MEDRQKDNQLAGKEDMLPASLASLNLPLFPLARNKRIRGTFPLIKPNGEVSKASIDVSIHWKYAYLFDADDHLVEKEISSELIHVPSVINGLKDPAVLPSSPVIRTVNAQREIMAISKTGENGQRISVGAQLVNQEEVQTTPATISKSARLQEILAQREENEEVEEIGLDDGELERRLLHIETPQAGPLKKVEKKKIQEPLSKLRAVPTDVTERVEIKPHVDLLPKQAVVSKSSSSGEEEDSVASDATYTASEQQAGEEAKEQPVHKVAEERMENRTGEQVLMVESEIEPDSAEEQMERILELGAKADLSVSSTSTSSSISLTPKTVPVAPVRRSLLGDLPSLVEKPLFSQPPATITPKRLGKAVDFTEPLHSSIPPSENSSYADSNNDHDFDLGDQQPKQRPAKHKVEVPSDTDITWAPPSLRTPLAEEEGSKVPEEEVVEGIRVRIRIGRLRVVEGSPLLSNQYENAQVFVEWNFLDFNRDICETPGTFSLPSNHSDICNIDSERVYELNRRRLNLLSQWTNSNNRLTFTLVLDPGDDQTQDFDDLCMAELNLKEVFGTPNHFITMRSIDNAPLAMLEVSINYSEKLMEYM